MILNQKIIDIISDFSAKSDHKNFYLYDMSVMAEKIKKLQQILPESVQIYYAMKANPHKNFLETAKNAGAKGIEIASIGEAKAAVKAGFNPSQIVLQALVRLKLN